MKGRESVAEIPVLDQEPQGPYERRVLGQRLALGWAGFCLA